MPGELGSPDCCQPPPAAADGSPACCRPACCCPGGWASPALPPLQPCGILLLAAPARYGRFHEGRTRLQAMSGAWLDGCIKVRPSGSRYRL